MSAFKQSKGFTERELMGFFVRKGRSEAVRFYLIEESWDKEAKKPVQKTVPTLAYQALGFRLDMTLDEAKERAKQLNQQANLESKTTLAIARRVEADAAIDKAYLPKSLTEAFEKELKDNYSDNPERLANLLKQWSIVQKMISELELDPKSFHDERAKFFNYYKNKAWGTDYIKKLTRLVNLWGEFVSRKRDQSFRPLPPLSDSQKERIIDIREGKKGIKTACNPLTWESLQSKRTSFEHESLSKQWNWMFVALWFGLRPKEVDSLKNQKNWKVERNIQAKCDALLVYQSKLTSVPKHERWKPIPIYTKEQKEALKLIESGDFKRPLNKTLRRFFDGKIECYSPRKGFTDLMLGLGFQLEDVSIFLGHRDISMTWRHYKSKQTFKLPS